VEEEITVSDFDKIYNHLEANSKFWMQEWRQNSIARDLEDSLLFEAYCSVHVH